MWSGWRMGCQGKSLCAGLSVALAAFLWISTAEAALSEGRCSAPGVTDRFDRMFQRATKRHLEVGFDWCWLKAWAMAESNLDPNAVSPVGAVGILQVMPRTGEWISKRYGGRLRDAAELKNANTNIRIAALYIAHLHRVWSYPRLEFCRTQLVQASYNAGPGNIIEAQKKSGGRLCWPHIQAFLVEVTGHHAKETTAYVLIIVGNYLKLKGLVQ